ncbi:MAG: hypothetical protein ABJG88_09670 [Litorimonas sp.]
MSHTVDDILLPLAITVVIDHKVKAPERTTFFEQAQGLLELFDMPFMDEKSLLNWFNSHVDDLEKKLTSKRKNTLILKALTRFTEDIEVENIYDAMVAISICDKEFAVDESDLIKSAASIWGFSRPPIKVDR